MRVYGLNWRGRPTSQQSRGGQVRHASSGSLPRSLDRLIGPCAEGFPELPEDATSCRCAWCDVGERC
jgi:hypothetical protein